MPTEKYFIGLDMGTDSVGWAVTDCDYKICKCGGKAMWGVRLFDEAKTSAERRTARIARRGTERRRQRLGWLQEVFSPEIAKVDPAFYQRLAESKFSEDDKIGELPLGKYTLFADKSYNDIHYHREFPTIYHLRYALMTEDREFDVRLVYLAVHHIMKQRGLFLFPDF
ncbi:MAG: type II CRISPR RNA-guided endonuclease Cas9, partial [Oscillospiraceae bacterium]|nr:type II CRISPR RNA-guided endonuclease Cas9 [Oscillospiraceae bacterium]